VSGVQNPELDFNHDGNLDVEPWESIMDLSARVRRGGFS